jgi:uncharacterized protein involved in high-affinity Fe2+ transport
MSLVHDQVRCSEQSRRKTASQSHGATVGFSATPAEPPAETDNVGVAAAFLLPVIMRADGKRDTAKESR